MGLLYDLADRPSDRFAIEDVDRPTRRLDVHRRLHHHDHPGSEGLPSSYTEALNDRPEVELVAGADRDRNRLEAFRHRYGVEALYTDAEAMLREERPDIVIVATNVATRADLTCLAVESGARGVLTEKPIAHTLEEADRMVETCRDAGVPLSCGAITTTHPSFARARELLDDGAIGDLVSIEAMLPLAQHQNWAYFLDSPPEWVVGTGDPEVHPPQDSAAYIVALYPWAASNPTEGSNEFIGHGIAVTRDGPVVHFRQGAPGVRLTGTRGEMAFTHGWRLSQDMKTPAGSRRVDVPWPSPQFMGPFTSVYAVADVIDCMEGRLDEPRNSGRRVAMAIEVEIALKQSSITGGMRVDLPLEDRSLGLSYAWFR